MKKLVLSRNLTQFLLIAVGAEKASKGFSMTCHPAHAWEGLLELHFHQDYLYRDEVKLDRA